MAVGSTVERPRASRGSGAAPPPSWLRYRGAREPVGRVSAEGDEVGDELGADPIAAGNLGRVDLLKATGALREDEDADLPGGALVHVAVAGEDQAPTAACLLSLPQRAEQVVGLELGVVGGAPAEGLKQRRCLLELTRQRVGHGGPLGVVGGVQLGAVVGGFGAEADHDRPGTAVRGDPQDHVDRPEQGVDPLTVGSLDRVGEGEERAVEDERSVDREQRSGHGDHRLWGQRRPASTTPCSNAIWREMRAASIAPPRRPAAQPAAAATPSAP